MQSESGSLKTASGSKTKRAQETPNAKKSLTDTQEKRQVDIYL